MKKTKFKFDKITNGWTLLENSEPVELKISKLELVNILEGDEKSVNGKEMLKRAKKMNCDLGQMGAEWLLDNQSEIPQEWRKYCLTFPGTIWRGSDGRRGVPYLDWDGERWCLCFGWLDYDWDSYDRLLRPRNLDFSTLNHCEKCGVLEEKLAKIKGLL